MNDDFDYHQFNARIKSLQNLKEMPRARDFSHSLYMMPINTWDKLYKFQKEGVNWLFTLEDQSIGGILGDEMGLGKTVQVVAFFYGMYYTSLFHDSQAYHWLTPNLIVCPATILFQWRKTILEWAPHLRVLIFYRNADKIVADIFKKMLFSRPGTIVITSYGHLRSYADFLSQIDWHFVVFDEGHLIKNYMNKVSKIAKSLNAQSKLISTGTPLQNNLTELWSLFDFTNPSLLGELEDFQCTFELTIAQGSYSNSTKFQVIEAYKSACTLRNIIRPFLMRRLKVDVISELKLPTKQEHILFVAPTEKQKDLYKEFLNSNDCQRIFSKQLNQLVGINKLRQICNHPYIYNQYKLKSEDHAREILSADFDCSRELFDEITDNLGKEFSWKDSGKLLVLKSLLDKWVLKSESPNKVLVFSQSISMLNLIGIFLTDLGIEFLRIDGSVDTAKRQQIIYEFETNPEISVFLLSTRVGGTGLNLTCANRVVIFDPDWNPSIDNQARERSWRIGQLQEVIIYRLITAGTIEEKMFKRQEFKQHLATKVLSNPKQKRISSQDHELADLFSYDFSTQNETANDIVTEIKGEIRGSNKPGAEKYGNLASRLSRMISNDHEKDNSELDRILNPNTNESDENFENVTRTQLLITNLDEEEPRNKLEKLNKERNESSEDELFGDTFKKINLQRLRMKNKTSRNKTSSNTAIPKDDPNILIYEAKNKAKEIIDQWKQSKKEAESAHIDHLMNNILPKKSSNLLSSKIKQRMLMSQAKSTGQIVSVDESKANSKLINDLLELFRANAKKLTTNQILDKFSDEFARQDPKVFKQVLRGIANFDKESKFWILSDAFL